MNKRAVVSLAVMACLSITSGNAIAADKKVKRLLYYNSGGYTVNYVELFWVNEEGKQKTERWGKDLTIGKGFCVNLPAYNKSRVKNERDPIPDGAEVWLKFDISGGDKESCRKSKKMVYSQNGGAEYFFSKGTLYNGNRCRRSKPPTSIVVNSGSGNCPFDNSY